MLERIDEAALSAPCSTFDVVEMNGTIVDRFQRVVFRNPVQVAIHHKGEETTYGELHTRSNILAHFLLVTLGGVKEPVALMFRHGVEHHVCQFAVLKAGKFYSNIDIDLRPERQARILANLGTRYLLHDRACENEIPELARRLPELSFVNIETLELSGFSTSPPSSGITASDYAVVVYTSGSTGSPQGVLLTHQNVLHLARTHGRDIRLSNADRATQICALWTGASTSEIFCTLLNEGTLYPYSPKTDGVMHFFRLLVEASITTMVSAPGLFRSLMQAVPKGTRLAAMRVIRLGGDRVTQQDVSILREYFTESCRLRIGYGASEFIPVSRLFIDHCYPVSDEIPVGYALEGCELAIVNDEGREMGPGEVGEIRVSSIYLSPGYWRNPQLTAERFRVRPEDTVRQYFTRDLGFKDADGRLHHVGRTDSRVKIYGKMVLITDIEQAILDIVGVTGVAVVPIDNAKGTNTELVAFVVCNSTSVDGIAIRTDLLKGLVPEIIPRKLVILSELPMLPNNKVDRMKLRHMAGNGM